MSLRRSLRFGLKRFVAVAVVVVVVAVEVIAAVVRLLLQTCYDISTITPTVPLPKRLQEWCTLNVRLRWFEVPALLIVFIWKRVVGVI